MRFGAGPAVRRGSCGSARVLRFGEGLPTPPKGPTEGLPIRPETFGRRRGSVGDRPQLRSAVRRGSPDPAERSDRRSPDSPGDLRSAAWLGRRPATTAAAVRRGSPDPAERSDRRSPHSPGDLRLAAWLGQRPATTAVGDRPQLRPRFGEGLPTPPKGPTEGLPIRPETFGRGRGSVRDRPQLRGSVGDRPQLRSQFGEGLPTPPKGPTEGLPIRLETFGRRRGSVGDRPQLRSETGHNCGPRFGEGLPTPPKGPTEGLPIRLETFGRRRGSVGDRPQLRRPATTAVGDRAQLRH